MAKKEIELLSKRVQSLEILVKELKLEVVLKRIKFIEETLFSTKDILNAKEVCLYLDISQSLLYKLTSSGEIPHFKPRGKMVFFEKFLQCKDTHDVKSDSFLVHVRTWKMIRIEIIHITRISFLAI